MLRNYLSVSFRHFNRQKGYSLINVIGLAVGLAVSVLITLFVRNELSYDRHLENGGDLYRVVLSADIMGQSFTVTNTPAPMAAVLMDEFPEIEKATRFDSYPPVLFVNGDRMFYEEDYFLADSTFFDMFSVPLIQGDARSALIRPNTLVISEDVARRYFSDENPVGKILTADNRIDYEVTGVMRLPDANTHFRPELLGSFVTSSQANSPVWLNNSFHTYIQTKPGTDPQALEAKFEDMVLKYAAPEVERVTQQDWDDAIEAGMRYEFLIEAVPDIYLHSTARDQIGPTGDIRYVYIMSVIALFVLVIACINFMNLATARAAGRAREVGMRKVMGSDRAQLIRQFLGESFATSLVAMVVAVGLLYLAVPVFNNLAGTALSPGPDAFGMLIGVTVLTGFLAGIYPAFVLSGFKPVLVLKGSFSSSSTGSLLRRALVVFQFAISIGLLVGTGVVAKQLHFIRHQDVGFDSEQVVVLPVETPQGAENVQSFADEISGHAAIVNAAAASSIPGPEHIHQTTVFRGEGQGSDEFFLSVLSEVTIDYVRTLGLEIVAGRDFSRDFPSDASGYLISEAAAREIGISPEELVGTQLNQIAGNDDDSDRIGTIVGVFRDAHFESLHEAVLPVILGMRQNRRYIPVRIAANRTGEALEYLKERWTAFEPGYPFRYFFLDEDYAQFYEQDVRLGKIYAWFTGLALGIACLGLFGLASYVTVQRTREIGVRKVLGASVTSVVFLLSREFTRLVLVACLVAFPIAWYAMRSWLQDFAYATTMPWWIFGVAGVGAVLIAWLTVSYQSYRAAVANPVDALNRE